MKSIVGVTRIFVGVLFIISGLIKLNDPVGFSFKLQDYFAPEVLNLQFLSGYALMIAIFVVIYEVLLGVMIIFGYAKKFTLWSLLLMILFFTFLTFYSAYFNKVTDCGCFGDALKLTPWQSFWKDVVLLALILILFFGKHHIKPFFTRNVRSLIVFASLVGCLALTYHVLMHLPVIDFRPYKIGANIQEGMSVPEGAPEPIFEYRWKFNVDGEEVIVTTNGDYPDQQGEFLGVETEEIQAGYEPPIHDFTIERGGEDFTETFLNYENLVLVIAYDLAKSEMEGFNVIKSVTDEALRKGYHVIGMSASSREVTEAVADDYDLNFKFYFCDMTTLKTIVRSNPGILELSKGTINQKLHWNDADELELNTLDGAIPGLNFELKRQMDSILVLDQQYRKLLYIDDMEERQAAAVELGLDPNENYDDSRVMGLAYTTDKANMEFIEGIFKEHGYPGKSTVGEPANKAAWYVVQHNSDRIGEFLPMIKEAGEQGELPFRLVAMMEDRYLMNQGLPQVYGTQGMSYDDDRGNIIWPIEDPENVNQFRKEAGFDQTIEEYAKDLFGPEFEYKVLTLDDIKSD